MFLPFEQWESHAINGIHAFKRNHLLSRHDEWYRNLEKRLEQHGGNKYWNMSNEDTKPNEPSYRTLLVRKKDSSDFVPVRYSQIYLSVGRGMLPGIGVFLPVDEAARSVFASFGSTVDYGSIVRGIV